MDNQESKLMGDIVAVRALKKGDRSAFKYLFAKYYDRIVAYITTYTLDKVKSEDIAQQTFINLWNDREKLDENKSPKAYLYAIAHNRYIDEVKKEKKRNKLMDQIWDRALVDRIQEDTETLEKRVQKMNKAIESLPPRCREIIKMNKVQGIKYWEIAEQLGVSVKTVESQMRIAFLKIRKAFEDDNLLLFLLFRRLSGNF